jgi:hypothetical protein
MGWTAREKDGLQEKRMDYKRKGWTERGKDGQQKDISVKESPKGPPDLSRVAQPSAARGGILLPPLTTTMAAYYRQIVSSGRLPNARRPEFVPLEQQRRSLEKVQRYLDAPVVEEDGLVSDYTRAHRQWLMRIWNK